MSTLHFPDTDWCSTLGDEQEPEPDGGGKNLTFLSHSFIKTLEFYTLGSEIPIWYQLREVFADPNLNGGHHEARRLSDSRSDAAKESLELGIEPHAR